MIFRRASILSLVVGCILTGPAAAQDVSFPPYAVTAHPSQDGRCQGDPGKADLDRSEKACLAQLASIATRKPDMLRLKFRNGSSKTYRDKPKECEGASAYSNCVKYQLTGYFAKHGLLLIEIDYYEGVEWMLVRFDSGREAKIVAPPYYSPGENWLVSACWSDGPSSCENGIDLVPTTPDQTVRDWHYRPPNDDYLLSEFVGWDGESRVNLTVTFHPGGQDSRDLKTMPASVELIDGAWQLKLPAEYQPRS
jgi:hypothetical protein